MSYDQWKLASPPEEEDDGRGHEYGQVAVGAAQERAAIVAWLRATYPFRKVQNDEIERGAHREEKAA